MNRIKKFIENYIDFFIIFSIIIFFIGGIFSNVSYWVYDSILFFLVFTIMMGFGFYFGFVLLTSDRKMGDTRLFGEKP